MDPFLGNLTPEEFKQHLREQFKDALSRQMVVRDKLLESQITTIYQRREWFKHTAIISSAILAFTPSIISNQGVYMPFAIIGASFHFFVIFIILAHFREMLDYDANEFRKMPDRYTPMFQEQMKIIINAAKSGRFDQTAQFQYSNNIINAEGFKEVKLNKEKEVEKQEMRDKNPSYLGEFIVFLFSEATFFMIISIISNIHFLFILSITILILALTFYPSTIKSLDGVLTRFGNFLTKKIPNQISWK